MGILISLCILFSGIFYDSILFLIKKICSIRVGKICFCTFSTAMVALILCFATALGAVISYSSTNAEKEQTIIILGCAVNKDKPSAMLTSRVNAACKYMRSNKNAVAVLSGGKGDGEYISEAECMYDLMIQMGIEKERLYIEDKSTNTNENIENSLKIIEENGLSKDIAIVSSDYHLKRASMIAEKNGIENPKRISASSGFFAVPTFYFRDALGVIKEFVIG
ncbi:MAG: YdcF family protein [Eubacterium sp.]